MIYDGKLSQVTSNEYEGIQINNYLLNREEAILKLLEMINKPIKLTFCASDKIWLFIPTKRTTLKIETFIIPHLADIRS